MVLYTLFASGCGRPESTKPRDISLPGGRVARAVVLYRGGKGMIQVEYRSDFSVFDCPAIQSEVRDLWLAHVRKEAERLGGTAVLIWPQDDSNAKRSYSLALKTGQWAETSGFVRCQ
jgi:hypothetical protein